MGWEDEMKKKIARIALLVVGVVLVWHVAATPGDQILFAVIAGACIGWTIGFILLEGVVL